MSTTQASLATPTVVDDSDRFRSELWYGHAAKDNGLDVELYANMGGSRAGAWLQAFVGETEIRNLDELRELHAHLGAMIHVAEMLGMDEQTR